MAPADHRTLSTLLVGREREQVALRDALLATLAGQGSLVLIGGEAGIGKTTLAEALCRDATEQSALVLVGRCYDLTETPPYGPWVELLGRYRALGDAPPLPEAFAQRGAIGAVASQAALFQQVQDFLTKLSAAKPTVILLDDLHWADPASLDLLRHLARTVADLPLLIIATYRADELTRHHPLYQLLPALVRESSAARLDLQPFTADDLRALIVGRYHLPERDTTALVTYLEGRSEGNPFFAAELLRALEEARALTNGDSSRQGGGLTAVRLPPLLRQVIDGRLARLGEEAEAVLEVAAVIGQEVPLTLWVAVGETDEDALLRLIERASAARVLEETPDGAGIRFTHALIREALYERIPAIRRRRLHRQTGAALVASPHPDPDAVAYHFQQAGDAQAAEWLMQAGERAQRAYAWTTAAERYEAALALMETSAEEDGKRGWLLYRLADMRKAADPRQGTRYLEEAERVAAATDDHALGAIARFLHGLLLVRVGERTHGLEALAAGTDALEALSPEELHLSRQNLNIVTIGMRTFRGTLIAHLADSGHYAEALAMGERFLAVVPAPTGETLGESGYADGCFGLTTAYGMLGRVAAAKEAIGRARAAYRIVGHHTLTGWATWHELLWLVLPYEAERVAARRALAAEAEAAWQHAGTTGFAAAPRFAWAHLLALEGRWEEAISLAHDARTNPLVDWRNEAISLLGSLAWRRGETETAWEQVRTTFPAGPMTEPGNMQPWVGAVIQRLAAYLALDAGDLVTARAWLEAHDRWLAWNGAVLGRAEGALGWATYYRTAGEASIAYQRAIEALGHANEPRQPLALLAAHRLLGELDTDAGRYAEAETHLQASLALADDCAAPYERALALLAIAKLRRATGDAPHAQSVLDEARTILTRLGATPALLRADQIATMLMTATSAKPSYPGGLSAREVEVLRLVAAGLTNAQVAERLFLSPHTINSHLTTIYTKLHLPSRTAAIRFALDHGLA